MMNKPEVEIRLTKGSVCINEHGETYRPKGKKKLNLSFGLIYEDVYWLDKAVEIARRRYHGAPAIPDWVFQLQAPTEKQRYEAAYRFLRNHHGKRPSMSIREYPNCHAFFTAIKAMGCAYESYMSRPRDNRP